MREGTDRAIGRVALGLSAILIVGLAVTGEMARWRPATAAAAYRTGDTVDLPRRYFDGHTVSLVIVVKSACPACEQSMAFLQRVRDTAVAAGLGVTWIQADHAAPGDLGRMRVVPSLLLIDQRGVVLDMKEGALPDAEQRALMERVRRVPGT